MGPRVLPHLPPRRGFRVVHTILTSLGSLTSLMRPCKGVLRPATTGFRRAVSPRKDTAEQRPSTPFPREEMAWTAMAAIHIVARILRTNVHHLNPVRRLAEPFSTAMLALSPGKLPTSCAPAHEPKHAVSRSHKECFLRSLALTNARALAQSRPIRRNPI